MSEHHITPLRTYLIIAASLLFLSGVTVWVSYIDLGSFNICLLYTSPSPRDLSTSRMPSSA
mgnify:CR=1 FL=1